LEPVQRDTSDGSSSQHGEGNEYRNCHLLEDFNKAINTKYLKKLAVPKHLFFAGETRAKQTLTVSKLHSIQKAKRK